MVTSVRCVSVKDSRRWIGERRVGCFPRHWVCCAAEDRCVWRGDDSGRNCLLRGGGDTLNRRNHHRDHSWSISKTKQTAQFLRISNLFDVFSDVSFDEIAAGHLPAGSTSNICHNTGIWKDWRTNICFHSVLSCAFYFYDIQSQTAIKVDSTLCTLIHL